MSLYFWLGREAEDCEPEGHSPVVSKLAAIPLWASGIAIGYVGLTAVLIGAQAIMSGCAVASRCD